MKLLPYNAKFRQVAQVDGMDEDYYSDVYESGDPTVIWNMCREIWIIDDDVDDDDDDDHNCLFSSISWDITGHLRHLRVR